MLKSIAIVLVIGVVAVLAYAATRPDTFRVARSATVQASPEKLHALINDLRAFNTWNPFEKGDARNRGEYSGPPAGPGATYAFGGGSAGDGTLRILDSAPTRVSMELHMVKPMEARNQVQFILQPRGAATDVTWQMEGESPFLGKLIGVFMNMDRMVGGQFESGLADLKQRAERT
jgi:Polyketide cyclase / dehydrase and lipid transport